MIKIYQTILNQNNLITTIPFKGVKVRVEFTGGNMMRGIPAKFYTSDPFTQKALDESDQNGRLFRLQQTVAEEGDVKPAKEAAVHPDAARTEMPAQVKSEQAATPPTIEPELPAKEEQPDAPGDAEGDDANAGQQAAVAGDDKLEFDNLGEAITYIAVHYAVQVETAYQARKLIEEREGRKAVIHNG